MNHGRKRPLGINFSEENRRKVVGKSVKNSQKRFFLIFFSNLFAVIISTGKRILQLFCLLKVSISFAVSFKSGSYSEFPIGAPLAKRNVLAIPPPIIMLSNFDTKFFRTEILVDTLEPPIIASDGFDGFS